MIDKDSTIEIILNLVACLIIAAYKYGKLDWKSGVRVSGSSMRSQRAEIKLGWIW